MRKKLALILTELFALLLLFSLPLQKADAADNFLDSTAFKDPALYKECLRLADHDGNGIVDENELNDLRFVNLEQLHFSSLAGLGTIPNLETVILAGDYSSFDELKKISHLKELDLSNTNFSDASILAGMTDLTRLDVENCPLKDLSFLKNMHKLEYLNVRNQGLSTLDYIANMPDLKYLYIDGNNITDISVVAKCRNLEDFCTNCNPIADFSPLKSCPRIKLLTIASDKVTDISFLNSLSELTSLNLWSCVNIKDYSPIESKTALTDLVISGSCLKTCPNFKGLTKLTSFVFDGSYLTEDALKAGVPARFADDDEWVKSYAHVEQIVQLENAEAGIEFEGDVLSDTELSVQTTDDYDDLFSPAIANKEGELLEVYDINLKHTAHIDENELIVNIQAAGDSEILFTNLADGEYVIFRRESDDTVTELNCTVKNGQLCFVTEHYSVFALVKTSDKSSGIGGGNGGEKQSVDIQTLLILIAIVVVIAAAIVVPIVVIRKKKKK